MFYLRLCIAVFSVTWIANCGDGNGVSVVSIAPTEPFILNVDRTFIFGVDNFTTIEKPSITFQLRIDNQGNPNPLTLVGLTLTVTGPKGTKVVPVDPAANLFSFEDNNLRPAPKAFFAIIPPFQAGYCMDKVTYFKEPNSLPFRSCEDIAADTTKITELGKSAANTSEPEGDTSSCCPDNSAANLSNIVVLIGGLQDFGEEIVPASQSYTINANFSGFYGSFIQPVGNFNTQVFFNARSN